jgi:hypothetical protein
MPNYRLIIPSFLHAMSLTSVGHEMAALLLTLTGHFTVLKKPSGSVLEPIDNLIAAPIRIPLRQSDHLHP